MLELKGLAYFLGFFLGFSVALSPCLAAKETSQPILYTGERYRDPTVSPLSTPINQPVIKEPPVQLPPLEVQGIIWGERDPRAIVNNRVVGKGDFVEGVEVLEISQKGIRLFFKGKSHFLRPGGRIEEK